MANQDAAGTGAYTLRRILIPVDGSTFAEHALFTGIALARRDGAELEIVTVVPEQEPPAFLEGAEPVAEQVHRVAGTDAGEYLTALRRRIEARVGGLELRTAVTHGRTIDALSSQVRERGTDLVVMTSHGRGPFRRAWLGSVADGVIRHSAAPVLLLRPPSAERPPLVPRPPFDRVLIPIDGSIAARRIFRDAVAVAGFEAVYTLLQSVGAGVETHPGQLPQALGSGMLVEDIDAIAGSTLGTAADELRALGVEKVDTVIVHGRNPAEQIVEYAELKSVDLIAMSTRGEGGIARLLLGSTADKVARSASCPVLLHRGTA